MLTRHQQGGYQNWTRDTPNLPDSIETIVIHNRPAATHYLHITRPTPRTGATNATNAGNAGNAGKPDSEMTKYEKYRAAGNIRFAKWALLISNYALVPA